MQSTLPVDEGIDALKMYEQYLSDEKVFFPIIEELNRAISRKNAGAFSTSWSNTFKYLEMKKPFYDFCVTAWPYVEQFIKGKFASVTSNSLKKQRIKLLYNFYITAQKRIYEDGVHRKTNLAQGYSKGQLKFPHYKDVKKQMFSWIKILQDSLRS